MLNKLRLTDRIFTLLSRSTRMDGLWIGSLESDSKELEVVKAALRLIQVNDSSRYSRINVDIDRIWIVPLIGSIGQYDPRRRTCKIDSRYVQSTSACAVALVIVHEAVHARLHKIGYTEALRPRIERACVMNELAFAKKLPDGDEVVAWVQRRLANPSDYSDRGLETKKRLAAMQEAEKIGIPPRLIHWFWTN